jgi:hypothetical protein
MDRHEGDSKIKRLRMDRYEDDSTSISNAPPSAARARYTTNIWQNWNLIEAGLSVLRSMETTCKSHETVTVEKRQIMNKETQFYVGNF